MPPPVLPLVVQPCGACGVQTYGSAAPTSPPAKQDRPPAKQDTPPAKQDTPPAKQDSPPAKPASPPAKPASAPQLPAVTPPPQQNPPPKDQADKAQSAPSKPAQNSVPADTKSVKVELQTQSVVATPVGTPFSQNSSSNYTGAANMSAPMVTGKHGGSTSEKLDMKGLVKVLVMVLFGFAFLI